jgi:hypothetical protein
MENLPQGLLSTLWELFLKLLLRVLKTVHEAELYDPADAGWAVLAVNNQ